MLLHKIVKLQKTIYKIKSKAPSCLINISSTLKQQNMEKRDTYPNEMFPNTLSFLKVLIQDVDSTRFWSVWGGCCTKVTAIVISWLNKGLI